MTQLAHALAYIQAHKMFILACLGSLSTFCTILNKTLPEGALPPKVRWIIDRLAAMAKPDHAGTFTALGQEWTVPYLTASRPIAGAKIYRIPPVPPAAIIIPLLFMLSGCSYIKPIAIGAGQCALNNLSATVQNIIPAVVDILQSGKNQTDINSMLTSLENFGVADVICAVQAALGGMFNRLPPPSAHAQPDPKILAAIQAGAGYLKSVGVGIAPRPRFF